MVAHLIGHWLLPAATEDIEQLRRTLLPETQARGLLVNLLLFAAHPGPVRGGCSSGALILRGLCTRMAPSAAIVITARASSASSTSTSTGCSRPPAGRHAASWVAYRAARWCRRCSPTSSTTRSWCRWARAGLDQRLDRAGHAGADGAARRRSGSGGLRAGLSCAALGGRAPGPKPERKCRLNDNFSCPRRFWFGKRPGHGQRGREEDRRRAAQGSRPVETPRRIRPALASAAKVETYRARQVIYLPGDRAVRRALPGQRPREGLEGDPGRQGTDPRLPHHRRLLRRDPACWTGAPARRWSRRWRRARAVEVERSALDRVLASNADRRLPVRPHDDRPPARAGVEGRAADLQGRRLEAGRAAAAARLRARRSRTSGAWSWA